LRRVFTEKSYINSALDLFKNNLNNSITILMKQILVVIKTQHDILN